MEYEENAFVCASIDCDQKWLLSSQERVWLELDARKLDAIKDLRAEGLTNLESCNSLGDLYHLIDYFDVRRLNVWERRFLARFRETYVMKKFHNVMINHDQDLYPSFWAKQSSLVSAMEMGARVREARA
jgi:hypothetical protein